MSGYVEAGYVVVLGTLGTYGITLMVRERAARRRVGSVATAARHRLRPAFSAAPPDPSKDADIRAQAGDVSTPKRPAGEGSGPGTFS